MVQCILASKYCRKGRYCHTLCKRALWSYFTCSAMYQKGTKSGKKRGFKMAKVILVVVKYMAFVGLYSKKSPKLTARVNESECWHPKAAKCPSKTSSVALTWSLLLMVFSWVASFLFTVHLITM